MLMIVVYCGLGGFLQLTHPVLMEEIISWQDPSGCFKIVPTKEGMVLDKEKSQEYAKIDPPLKGTLCHNPFDIYTF